MERDGSRDGYNIVCSDNYLASHDHDSQLILLMIQ